MSIDNAKIYGLCIERLKHQITLAGRRNGSSPVKVVLESYNTGDLDEIIDILELYDLGERTPEALAEKLEELSVTASMLTGVKLEFGYSGDGDLCLYLVPRGKERPPDWNI